MIRHGENRGNRIHGEDQIRTFDNEQNEEKWRGDPLPGAADEEFVALVVLGHRHDPLDQFNQWIVFGMYFFISVQRHADPRKDQEAAEYVNDPMELLEQSRADENQRTAHKQCTQNTPEQHMMLISSRDGKERENQN